MESDVRRTLILAVVVLFAVAPLAEAAEDVPPESPSAEDTVPVTPEASATPSDTASPVGPEPESSLPQPDAPASSPESSGPSEAPANTAPERAAPEDASQPEAPQLPQASSGEPATDDWADPEVLAFLERQGLASSSEEQRFSPKFALGGFADVSIRSDSDQPIPRFGIGQVVGHGRTTLGKGFGAFTEVSVNSTPYWEVRVERFLFSYESSDAFRVSLGRFHIPVTWWNARYHHGLWLQTAVRRPLLIGYSDAWIPNHAVGVRFDGRLPFAQALGIRYHLSVNGGGAEHGHALLDDPDHNHPPRLAATWGLQIQPAAIANLTIGSFGYWDPTRIRSDRTSSEMAIGNHIAYTSELPEILVEYVAVIHQPDGADERYISHGGYVQVGARLPGRASMFKPYVRYERTYVDPDDPSLVAKSTEQLALGGVRADLTGWFALTAEGVWRLADNGLHKYEAALQASAVW